MNRCDRCNGMMVLESMAEGYYEFLSRYRLRCVACGNQIDPIILSNRKNQEERMAVSA